MEAGGFEVGGGWAVASAVVEGVLEEEVFEAADTGFDGAVVGGCVGRGEERCDVVVLQKLLDFVCGEVRAVVGFEDQWRGVLFEERVEAVEGDLCGGVVGGECEKLTVCGEVADGEAPSVPFVNRIEQFGVVDAPDAAWCVPVELIQFLLMLVVAIATEGFEMAGEFAAGDIGEDEFEAWDADGGAQVVERVYDGGACDGICELDGASARVGFASTFAPSGERVRYDVEVI